MAALMRPAPVVAIAAALLAGAPAAGAVAQPDLALTVDRTHVRTGLGREFVIRSEVVRSSSAGSGDGVILHLNVFSLHPGVYVDPEDWSSDRTRYVHVPDGGTVTSVWRLHAVNHGSFALYVTAVPAAAGGSRPVSSPVVVASVASRRTLDPGGVVPLALGVPSALLALTLAARRLRRRPG
jgi:hypothetical protein